MSRSDVSRRPDANASVDTDVVLLVADILDLALRRYAVPKDLEEALDFVRSQLEGLGGGHLDVERVSDALGSVASTLHRLPGMRPRTFAGVHLSVSALPES